ncbi:energy transducer TonB [Thalassotalea sp. G2M2-11]|uniref:energy transducer TonB n=1 Tax=Thalassotalea sp. G2M2-11 TaxID=2787627 RepID=UPI0019D172B4|nr:energy transducer TonB [Thalassotalea sp. G2M2-11]
MLNFFLWFLFVCLTANAFADDSIKLSKQLAAVVQPEPIKRVNPKYPMKAAREGRAGWAKFSFIVEKDGTVSNVVELKSSGSKDITKAAKQAIKNWRYEPAMENGEPIQQCVNTVKISFKMEGGSDGVRKKFRKAYQLAIDALKKKDYPEFERLKERLQSFKYRHIGEHNYLQSLLALHAEQLGDSKKQLAHLSNISFINDDEKSQQFKHSVLSNRFMLAIKLSQFKMASDVYQQLMKLDINSEQRQQYNNLMEKVEDLIASEKAFVVAGDIGNKDFWHYSLVRNEFTLTEISGRLTKLDVRCANKRHVYTVENNNSWKLPSAWRSCDLYIYGENNSQFKLIEHGQKT